MKNIGMIAAILLIVGGINWGLIGLANMDIFANLFGAGSTVAKAFYILVGVAAVLFLLDFKRWAKPATT